MFTVQNLIFGQLEAKIHATDKKMGHNSYKTGHRTQKLAWKNEGQKMI